MKSEKHIIFTSEPDYKAGEESIEEQVKDVKSTLETLAGLDWLGSVLANTCEKKIEELKLEEAYRQTDFWWESERANLDIETTGEIVIIAGLGLWDGRRSAVKETGKHNVNVILDYHGDVDDIEVYVEDGEVRGLGHHHDGTNEYTFREVIDTEKWEKLSEKIAGGEKWTQKELDEATRSLADRVNKVYGWK